jgi:hypothetical protein
LLSPLGDGTRLRGVAILDFYFDMMIAANQKSIEQDSKALRRLIRQEGVVARFDVIDDLLSVALSLTYLARNDKGRAEYQPNQTIVSL